jgi:hypothetical protein
MKKLISLALLVGLISLVPSPPIGHHASADRDKPPSIVQKVKTTHVEALQANPEIQPVVDTTPTQTPVLAIPTYPTEASEIMNAAGIATDDQKYVQYIVEHEGGWCPSRWQGQSVCTGVYDPTYNSLDNTYEGYGLCQSTPGNKMASAGDDYITNPVTQMSWCNTYAISRYGSWSAAYSHWIANGNW